MGKNLNQLGQIWEGWKNLVFKDPEIEAIALPRLDICADCPIRTNGTCDKNKELEAVRDFVLDNEKRIKGQLYKGCNCNLEAKARCKHCKCPIGKW